VEESIKARGERKLLVARLMLDALKKSIQEVEDAVNRRASTTGLRISMVEYAMHLAEKLAMLDILREVEELEKKNSA
jgi:hypothetical protein